MVAIGGGPIGTRAIGETESAPDRYLSVKKYEQQFSNLENALTRIKNEYAQDHNKREFSNSETASELLGEVDATLAQIKHGRVRSGQLIEGLGPTLQKAAIYFAAYDGLTHAIRDAIDILKAIAQSLGLA